MDDLGYDPEMDWEEKAYWEGNAMAEQDEDETRIRKYADRVTAERNQTIVMANRVAAALVDGGMYLNQFDATDSETTVHMTFQEHDAASGTPYCEMDITVRWYEVDG